MKTAIKLVIATAILGALVAGAWWGWNHYVNAPPGTSYRTVAIKRGDLQATIAATGTVEPEEVVDVGAQVAGEIKKFGMGADGKPVDYGSPVEVGTVLAEIDKSLYQADYDVAQATVEQAQANVGKAQADLGQMKAKLVQATADWERARKIGPSDALAQNDYDAFLANFDTAQANLKVGEKTLLAAEKGVAQAQATLRKAQRTLDYCTITSPVKGVIIDRRVNTGQTVVSSLNAPSLFLIAKDLTRIQVWVSVNEADIGKIHVGQKVSFTVDAFPGREFHGEVSKRRLNAVMTQNVVSYTVEVTTDNADGTLLPYQTANVQFDIDRSEGVLIVPNAALRWYPTPEQIAPDARAALTAARRPGSSTAAEGGSKTPRPATTRPATTQPTHTPAPGAAPRTRGMVWVVDRPADAAAGAVGAGGGVNKGYVRPIMVTVGVTDGINTEVQSDKLQEGMEVITGEAKADAGGNDTANPFVPQFRKK